MLTFDEFLEIPPCTEGKHSTTDLPPQVEKKAASVSDAELQRKIDAAVPKRKPIAVGAPKAGQAQHPNTTADGPATPPPPQPEQPPQDESDSDDPAVPVPEGRICRRRGCGVVYSGKDKEAWGEGVKCVHHPGHPIFHEGSKGYSCCKRRVLEFDQFMKIEGCRTKDRHLFVGSGKREKRKGRPGADGAADDAEGKGEDNEELLETVRCVGIGLCASAAAAEMPCGELQDKRANTVSETTSTRRHRRSSYRFSSRRSTPPPPSCSSRRRRSHSTCRQSRRRRSGASGTGPRCRCTRR